MKKGSLVISALCIIATVVIAYARYAYAWREDCISYNTRSLRIVDEGVNGWLLTDGRSRMLTLDNEEDATAALALARGHTQQCFIGRDNRRPNRKDYIVEYWK